MSSHRFNRPLVAVAALFALFGAVQAATPPAAKGNKPAAKNAVNFERAKQQIDTLLTQRQKPAALPDPLPNPFQVAETAAAPAPEKDGKPSAADPLPVSSDTEMLMFHAASLRISGTVTIEGRTHLVINQTPYKEGDLVTLKTKDGPVKLRVIAIAPGEVTLGLNEAVQVTKYKK